MEETQKEKKGFFRELFNTLFWVVVILVPIRTYVAQPFIVVGTSMYPTLKGGDYLIIDELSYRFKNPERGDVIVFKPPQDKKNHYVKRIIALPNETISIENDRVKIINNENPNGFYINESNYISSKRPTNLTVRLNDDEYFVMGDNREASSDSRNWGTLHKELITGRALVRLFPVKDIDSFPGKMNIVAENK